MLRLVARAGSLRRFLLLWQLGWLWLVVAVLVVWQFALVYSERAAVQDQRLLRALAELRQLVAATTPQALPDAAMAWMAASGMQLKLMSPSGEWLAGRRDWQTSPGGAGPAAPGSFTNQYDGVLLHGLRARLSRPAAGPADPGNPAGAAPAPGAVPGAVAAQVDAQVALPLSERLPNWADLHIGAPAWLLAIAAACTCATATGAWLAMGWLRAASEDLATQGQPAAPASLPLPAELTGAASRLRQIADRQQSWVDAQNRFVADASHQLRTPLAVLRSQLQALQNHELPVAQALPRLLHTLDHATEVANRFLGLSKLEQVRREGRLAAVPLRPLVCDVVVALGPLIGAKRLQFALDGPDAEVAGDAPMLGELLSNLLANAIHHTPPAGHLGVLVRDIGGQPELVIWDEGCGLDDAERANRFQPFVPSHGGGGLGLSICNQIAQAMGASLRLHNRIAAGKVVGVDAILTWQPPLPLAKADA